MPSARRKKTTDHGGLTFVNVQHPDDLRLKCTQTVIRSGAMAAIGLTRRKRPRPVTVELEVKEDGQYGHVSNQDTHRHVRVAVARQSTGLANAEPWFPSIAAALPHLGHFAVEPDRRARELLSFMEGEASYIYRPFRAEWFNMAVLEPSAYYLCLANAALFLNQFLTGHGGLEYTDCVESSKYYGLCLSKVTGQLADQSRGITQGLVTTVLGFVCHNLSLGNWDRCDMHLEGLERIISARGGFHSLGPYVPYFASWFDVSNSAVHDRPPRFLSPGTVEDGPAQHETLSEAMSDVISQLTRAAPHLSSLGDCLTALARVASYCKKNTNQPGFWEGGPKAANLIGPVAHLALQIPRFSLDLHSAEKAVEQDLILHEAVRLAILVFIAALKQAFTLTADEILSLTGRLEYTTSLMDRISCFPELRLWVNIVCASSTGHQVSRHQMSEIRRAMRDLRLIDSQDVFGKMEDLIWIPRLFKTMSKLQIDEQESGVCAPAAKLTSLGISTG